MRIAYFDCFAGLSGEMMLAALIGAGLSPASLKQGGYNVPTNLNGSNDQRLPMTEQLVGGDGLPEVVRQTSLAVLNRLALAKATAYTESRLVWQELDPEELSTVVGVILGLSLLGIGRVECSPLHIGSGFVGASNGSNGEKSESKPALSPITAEIVRSASVPVYGSSLGDEVVTPVGAAIIATVCSKFGPTPPMTIKAIGYGTGKISVDGTPRQLRLLIGESIAVPDVVPKSNGHVPSTADKPDPQMITIATKTQTVTAAKPFITIGDEWIALSIKGHQQSGRQRS